MAFLIVTKGEYPGNTRIIFYDNKNSLITLISKVNRKFGTMNLTKPSSIHGIQLLALITQMALVCLKSNMDSAARIEAIAVD